jgi:hypothetical protein
MVSWHWPLGLHDLVHEQSVPRVDWSLRRVVQHQAVEWHFRKRVASCLAGAPRVYGGYQQGSERLSQHILRLLVISDY